MLLGVAFSLFSFPCYFLPFLALFIKAIYLGQHASLLAYTGYPGLYICMSLERSMDFPWISMCPSRTNLGKQTNKQTKRKYVIIETPYFHPQLAWQHSIHTCVVNNNRGKLTEVVYLSERSCKI